MHVVTSRVSTKSIAKEWITNKKVKGRGIEK